MSDEKQSRPTIISAEYLPMLDAFRAREDVRYYLNGFAIQPDPVNGGALLMASDGHRVIIIHDSNAWAPCDQIWSVDDNLVAACVQRRHDPAEIECECPRCEEIFEVDAGRSTREHHVLPQRLVLERDCVDVATLTPGPSNGRAIKHGACEKIDGQYPDLLTGKAIPGEGWSPGVGMTVVNPKYLASACVPNISKHEGIYWMHRASDNGDGPIVGRLCLRPEIMIAIMPLRADAKHGDLPAWFTAARSAAHGDEKPGSVEEVGGSDIRPSWRKLADRAISPFRRSA